MLRQTVLEAAGNLLGARQRSILALLGILIGAGAVIAMLNVGAMAQNETAQQFKEMGTDMLSVRSGDPAGLKLADVQGMLAAIPSLASVAPFTTAGATAVFEGTVQSPPVAGVTESFARIANLRPQEGRFISEFDRFELYCVLGSQIAQDLSSPGFRVRAGSEVRIGRYVFRVLSILAPALGSPMMPMEVNGTIFMSIPNSRRVSPAAILSTALARVRSGADPVAVSAEVQAYFTPKLRGAALDVQSAQQLIAGMAKQMQLFQLLLGAVGAIALVLGGVGVMNIMLVSVQERRREIGIRLAIGARRRDIQTLFLAESVILALLGAVLGIGLGLAASYGFARLSHWAFMISPAAAPLGAGVSVAVGVFFGFYPAWMAARLDPIEALRAE